MAPVPVLRRREGLAFLAAFAACIPVANWLIGHVGTVCTPEGLCLIPVAPGLMAPSGVVMIGLALVLRDLVQRRLGLTWALAAIAIGGAISGLVSPPALVFASVAAFMLSELADLLVYTPLQKRGLILAVVVSGAVGIVVDTLLFLYLAFGDISFFWGQAVGKAWMVLLALPFIAWLRQRDRRIGLAPLGTLPDGAAS
ncbi:VUT family protein [Rhodoligotrophos defluvii]|uniref:VUT family protein n=1 Tax=Rhodoligotrophos defluvii TaxID=2561934 RepID=UPI0010C991A1|nr:VUT family protein [Rhodoligotrophos defluvii]